MLTHNTTHGNAAHIISESWDTITMAHNLTPPDLLPQHVI